MVQHEVQYAVTQLPLVVGQDTTFPDYTGLRSRGAVKPLLPLSTTKLKKSHLPLLFVNQDSRGSLFWEINLNKSFTMQTFQSSGSLSNDVNKYDVTGLV